MAEPIILDDILEKRQDYRIACALPIQVALGGDPTPVVGELRDISTTGLRMRLNRALRPGEEYPVYIASHGERDGMLMSARPVWLKATRDGYGFDIGCEFTDGCRMPDYFSRAWGLAVPRQKRRTVRLSGTFDTQLSGRNKLRIHAVTRDVSMSGAGIVSPVAVPFGTKLTARFDFVPHGVFRATIEVVHCSALPGDLAGYQLGVAFWPLEAREARRLTTVLRKLKQAQKA